MVLLYDCVPLSEQFFLKEQKFLELQKLDDFGVFTWMNVDFRVTEDTFFSWHGRHKGDGD